MNTALIKQQLIDFTQQQKLAFHQTDVLKLIQQRSDFYDELLQKLWQHYELDKQDLTLIAVGGYGRREMFPLSDLDILILSETSLTQDIQDKINQLVNLLWDCKLQLGIAVRTLTECLDIGRQELSVATNMFESRFLVGNKALWQNLMSQLYQPDFWHIAQFYQAKIEEQQTRYARYNNTSYNLEPDLKHSPGGLRDLHLLSWIMLRQYGIFSLEKMQEKGILFDEEYQELQQAQHTLFRMRFALHLQLKRYDNRLRFDRQLQLSEQLGYVGEGNQPVEAMMKTFFQSTQSISQLSQLLLNSFRDEHFLHLQKTAEKQPLDPHFYLHNNEIYCHNPRLFLTQPQVILDLFFHLTQQQNAEVMPKTLRQLRLALQKLTHPLSYYPEARQRFIQILQQPNCIKRAIVPMHQLGVLSAYIPQWQGIEGLMQFDLFHLYTVDEHTVRVMLKLESFLDQINAEKHPLCCQLMPTFDKPEFLYLAALFHDIAKGRDGDHAQEGAKDMRQFAELHNFNSEEIEYMAWLVEQHLTMSITAQRRDIHDPNIVETFAKIVKNPTALQALTCLTVADICATNENLWNSWKQALFQQLYGFTLDKLDQQGSPCNQPKALAEQHRQQALKMLAEQGDKHQEKLLADFWKTCPESYFIRNTPTQLVWHATHIPSQSLPLVLVSNQYARAATEIFIHCHDQAQLFARIAQTLSIKKISIHDAQIITSEAGLVLDSFIVTEQNGQPLSDERSRQIQQALVKILNSTQSVFKLAKKPIKHKSFQQRKTQIRFLANSQPNQTAFELFTLDREGLLAQISEIFNQLKLNLVNAKITTIGERVEDFFVVTTQTSQALSDDEKNQLREKLIKELEKE